MLKTQEYLKEKAKELGCPSLALDALKNEFKVEFKRHHTDDLVILNYCQIESPKHAQIVRECRGLTLNMDSDWSVAARSFFRFFNAGEFPAEEAKFDWSNFTAETKEDGSLMTLYNYKGLWHVNTRASFAISEIQSGVGKTWEEAFYSALGNSEVNLDSLDPENSYVFEFCSRWNKVVRDYPEPTLFLLSAFHNKTGHEKSEVLCDRWAEMLGVKRPVRFSLSSLSEVAKFVNEQEATFEGCVLRDRNGLRLKVKNKSYVALHQLKGNGNLFMTKNLVPLILKNEHHEVLAAFPEAAEKLVELNAQMGGDLARAQMAWDIAKQAKTQKDFALLVNKYAGPLKSILFEARKHNLEPYQVWRKSESVILKSLGC